MMQGMMGFWDGKQSTSLQTDNHTNTSIFTGWMLFLVPNQQCQSTEGNINQNGNAVKILVRASTSSVVKV